MEVLLRIRYDYEETARVLWKSSSLKVKTDEPLELQHQVYEV